MYDVLNVVGTLIALIVGVLITVFIAGWPGRIAKRRGHPNREAINICGWIGILLWPCWIVAIIWAHTSTKG
ncbi:MAG: DUF3302 domain-containing protein [Planctomycetes bacterium]|nr:DUF3302 domain-containing protein [Planctomycetota bacterium]